MSIYKLLRELKETNAFSFESHYSNEPILVNDSTIELIKTSAEIDRSFEQFKHKKYALEAYLEELDLSRQLIYRKRGYRKIGHSLEDYQVMLGLEEDDDDKEKKSKSSEDSGFFGTIWNGIKAFFKWIWDFIKSIGRFFGRLFGLVKDEEKKTKKKLETAKTIIDSDSFTIPDEYKDNAKYVACIKRFNRRYKDYHFQQTLSDILKIKENFDKDITIHGSLELLKLTNDESEEFLKDLKDLIETQDEKYESEKIIKIIEMYDGFRMSLGEKFTGLLNPKGTITQNASFPNITYFRNTAYKLPYGSLFKEHMDKIGDDVLLAVSWTVPEMNYGGLFILNYMLIPHELNEQQEVVTELKKDNIDLYINQRHDDLVDALSNFGKIKIESHISKPEYDGYIFDFFGDNLKDKNDAKSIIEALTKIAETARSYTSQIENMCKQGNNVTNKTLDNLEKYINQIKQKDPSSSSELLSKLLLVQVKSIRTAIELFNKTMAVYGKDLNSAILKDINAITDAIVSIGTTEGQQ